MSDAYSQLHLDGIVGQYLSGLTDNWLLVSPLANPAMLEIFADRDSSPYRNMMPWAGEFAGKYLTSAVQVYRVTRDPRLLDFLKTFVERLLSFQAPDGYLGPWPTDSRLTNFSLHHGQDGLKTWDTWGHYHMMIGLMLWFEETGDSRALDSTCHIADLICQKYLGEKPVRLVETGNTEMNLAPVHALAKLYDLTGTSAYLEMARQIVEEFSAQDAQGIPLAGDFFRLALAGKSLHEMPRPRWESLHSILALVEFYKITGDIRYREAFENIWWGIVEHDRHNNGGFSTREQAVGNPYEAGPIETCCTIAWTAVSAEMLHLTHSSVVADELELTLFNSILGMHSASGRWATYDTPMDGARFASGHTIVFQARSGSPELNCCSVNSPRGLGLLSEWAVLQDSDGLALNYYGPCSIHAALENGVSIELHQETDYPRNGTIKLTVSPAEAAAFTLRLRVPYWSRSTGIRLNGKSMQGVSSGSYYEVQREWQPGDQVEISFDFSLHIWNGEGQCQGLASIFRGPLLLAYDQRYNRHLATQPTGPIPDDPLKVTRDLLPVPVIDASRLDPKPADWPDWHAPLLLLQGQTEAGGSVYLCDFASAGATGTLYRSWLPTVSARPARAFSRDNPLRSERG